MASICTRCALRFQRAAVAIESQSMSTSKRAFSITTRRDVGIPTFSPTSNTELDDALTTIRNKHFIPGYLSTRERRMIFGDKHRVRLQENPQSVLVGEEEIPLQWIDRRKEIPARRPLVNNIIKLMAEGKPSDWNNLPSLLTGLRALDAVPAPDQMELIIRKAILSQRIGILMQCLHQVHSTGMTLKRREVVSGIMWGLHHTAQRKNWSQDALLKAIKDANEVAKRLESEEHGEGKELLGNDPRTRPWVLAVFLELSAVYALKFQDGKDIDGKVKAYSERLLSCMLEPGEVTARSKGMPWGILRTVPKWHGLSLAQRILGAEMPQATRAQHLVEHYEAGLSELVGKIEGQNPQAGSYGDLAIRTWKDCIRE